MFNFISECVVTKTTNSYVSDINQICVKSSPDMSVQIAHTFSLDSLRNDSRNIRSRKPKFYSLSNNQGYL